MDEYAIRPCHRSLKMAGPCQGTMWQVRDRDMDRHAMQSEVGYLFSGLWRGKEEGEKSREAERETERDKGERQKLPLQEGDGKGRDSGWKLKISLPQLMGEWVWLVS